MAKQKIGSTNFKLRKEHIKKAYECGRKGLPRKYMMQRLGSNETTWYSYNKTHKRCSELPEDEFNQLPELDQLKTKFVQAFNDGFAEFAEQAVVHINTTEDERLRLEYLARLDNKTFGPKSSVDLEDLDIKIRKEYGHKAADAVLEVLEQADDMEAEEDEN